MLLASSAKGAFCPRRHRLTAQPFAACAPDTPDTSPPNPVPAFLPDAPASCACPCSPGGLSEVCAHLLFVLQRVLKVPAGNPILWQLSLTDRELDEVLRCGELPAALQPRPKAKAAPAPAEADDQSSSGVKRKAVEAEEPCPICYEAMSDCDPDMLVWCRAGCGNNVRLCAAAFACSVLC